MNPSLAPVLQQLLSGRSAGIVALLIVLYGAYDLLKTSSAAFDKANETLIGMSKNIDELRMSVVRLTDTMVIVRDNIKDHEDRLRLLEEKKRRKD